MVSLYATDALAVFPPFEVSHRCGRLGGRAKGEGSGPTREDSATDPNQKVPIRCCGVACLQVSYLEHALILE